MGLHYGGFKKENNNEYSLNLATIFDSIMEDILKKYKLNSINCIYIPKDNEKEI